MRTIAWFRAAAVALGTWAAAPLRADVLPPERPVRLVDDATHSPALISGLVALAIAGLVIFLYRRQRK
jgi:hypothetical protein